MYIKRISVILICLFAVVVLGSDISRDASGLTIYLPKEVTITDSRPKLGQVSVISGDESLVDRASGIVLGDISVPGQRFTVDRDMLLSRLGSVGISSAEVQLKGSDRTVVKKLETIVGSAELVQLASSYLDKHLAGSSVCGFEVARECADLVLSGDVQEIKLIPEILDCNKEHHAKVKLTVIADGEVSGSCEITFRLKYQSRDAIAKVDIVKGALITPENVRIENGVSDFPEPVDWASPFGMVARRFLPAEAVIRPSMLVSRKPELLIKRNQNVVIKIDTDGLSVTAIGKSLQDGRIGEYIKVRNIDSQRIIFGKVNEDGTIEPVI